ncbi:MAG: gliding motility-associated C-terminal domain-containing protein [Flammeovirgaceae bacterium]|nr:MAG: gliding motility-associated C-terminal domain-containing protein [Flammeovirgaceae bacterium]
MRLSFLLVVLPTLGFGQFVSTGGRFEIDQRKGCAALTVTITNANLITTGECTGLKPCDMVWGDGTPIQQNVFSHTYTQPGTYTLQVNYQNIGPDQIQITVRPNLPPEFNIFTCNGNQVQVRVTDTNYDAYIINYNDASPEVQVPKGSLAVNNHTFGSGGSKNISVRGKDVNAADNCMSNTQSVVALATLPTPFIDELRVVSGSQIDQDLVTGANIQYRLEIATNNNSTFQLAQTVYNSTAASLTNLRPDDNYYCFRLGAFDMCTNTTTAYSNIICSTNFDLAIQNNVNNLTWVTHPAGIANFSVNRDGTTLATPVASPYSDTNITCGTTYCYQVTSSYANGSQSISLQKCGQAISTDIPTATNNVTAVVSTAGVALTWLQDVAFTPVEYTVFRKSGSGSFGQIGQTTVQNFTDNQYTTAGEFCYLINYRDVCGNASSPGLEVCPIRLAGSLTNENAVNLSWTPYAGWRNGVSNYVVEKYDAGGSLVQVFNTGTSTTLFDDAEDPANQVFRYVVKANANDGGLGQAVSNEISIIKEPKLYYPTAFTPDNQGPPGNEIFKVFGRYIARFEMKIYNRWGELLFVSDNLDTGWDGTFKGKEQPEGTYAFVASLTDLAGRSFTRSGSVVLLRKK